MIHKAMYVKRGTFEITRKHFRFCFSAELNNPDIVKYSSYHAKKELKVFFVYNNKVITIDILIVLIVVSQENYKIFLCNGTKL